MIQSDKNLLWQDVPEPIAQNDEITIQVHATAINRADLMQRAGLYPPPQDASPILGLECAGLVIAIGPDVTKWKIGDRVCALLSGGGYAETVTCPEGHALQIPDHWNYVQAASIPEAYATAWLNLYQLAQAQQGEKIVIHAGASGVGTAAIQLCKAMGNPVFVTVGNQEKLNFCLNLGADAGHIRHDGPFDSEVKSWSGNEGVNVILDPVSGQYLEQNLSCLGIDGRLIVIGLMGGRHSNLDLGRILIKRIQIHGSTLRNLSKHDKNQIMYKLSKKLSFLIQNDFIKPIIHDIIPINNVLKAFEAVAANKTIGKVILTVR